MSDTTEWDAWRKCRICGRRSGEACIALGVYAVESNRREPIELDVPHAMRERRSGR